MAGQRLDRWLWFTRIVKTRTLATRFIAEGRLRVNREKIDKPSRTVRAGDVVTASVHDRVLVLRVLDEGVRRGPAAEAQTLYEDLTPPALKGPEALAAPVRRERGAGRPTKRDRRRMDGFTGRDEP